ncbi:MAG TPA: DEAD/DEAH box helicase [Pseudonocardiaceae bacterium]|jgi:superfamily II DNA or RNA helicase|nr:DEAD/DEAH box helicase [Pseudonocardiaceae bacterium]
MPPVVPGPVDLANVEEAVSTTFYDRGVDYARRNQVLRMRWDQADLALHGSVIGKGGLYDTSAYFAADDQELLFEQGQCTCPVGFNCKHVAALVISAVDRSRATPARAAQPPTWKQSLDALLASDPVGRAGTAPLGIELALTEDNAGSAPRVTARLVTPGRNGWVHGGLSWGKLSQSHHMSGYLAEHVRLLRELYAVYRSGREGQDHSYGYYSPYTDDKSIDFARFESRQLWTMLDEAASIGLALVHARKGLGPVQPYGSAEFCLDVTRAASSGALAIHPMVRVEDSPTDAAPIRFIGSTGHGVVYMDRAEIAADRANWHVRLARLVKPVPRELRELVLDDRPLLVPAAEHDRFRDDYCPRLRRAATVVSSDGSFTPPEISAPILVLRADYGDHHDLALSWEWAYQVGGTRHRVPLDAADTGDGYRDTDAERSIIASLDVPRPTAAHAVHQGVDTMRFTTETLPLLLDRADIDVDINGDPADYREVGDTLSIGVSTTEVPGENDWFDLGVTITVEGHDVPFTDVFVALAGDQSEMLLPDGAYFSLDKPELRRLRTLIDEARALRDMPSESLRISRFQAGLWDELSELGVVAHQARAWEQQVAGLLSIDALAPVPAPATLDARLRPYQLDGFRWLAFLWQWRLGGILADDMGLGKTVQSLALISHAKLADPTMAPFLVIAPASVVGNWAAEASRFTPGLTVAALTDTVRRRGRPLPESVAGADVVVTSYTLFRLDFDDYAELSWSGLILDEAQQVKNHQSKIYQCARKLPVPFKLAITGTPMENNLMELWSLLSITAPGLFPNPARFKEYYAQPIEKQGHTELLGRLRRRMKPLVMRRTKEQVAPDLPDKQEQVLEVELHPRHRKLYQTHLQRERQKVLGLVEDMNKNRFTILRSLTLLRQLSLHAGLVDDANADLPSAKIDALVEQLHDVIDGSHRALVFSQFTGFLRQVRDRLDAEGIEYCYLDGGTRDRPAVLERFKNGSRPVFLISLKAGGFGLNLTEADYCFLLDPWWNPATEAQAVDRTHRIGQTRNVMVYRVIAKNTIEERVMALQARKAELFANVMDEGNVFGTGLDAEDIRELFA